MKIRLLITSIIAGLALAVTGVASASLNVGNVKLSTGQNCNASQCQFIAYDSDTGTNKIVVTGSGNNWQGWFYVYPNWNYQYLTFTANAYFNYDPIDHLNVYARMACGGGGYQYSAGKSYFNFGAGTGVWLGQFQLSGVCQTASPVG